jgi:pathogenesis-related protein 1
LSLFVRWPQRLAHALLLACLASACGLTDLDDPRLPGGPSELLDAGGGASEAGSGAGGDAAGLHEAAVPVDAAPVLDARPVAPAGPEPGLLAGITAEHNAARARLVSGTPLPSLAWSPEIALVAQAYADKLARGCVSALSHSTPTERQAWGENLASFSITGGHGDEPNGSPQQTVSLWESELACYTFGPFQSGVNETCSAACRDYGGCGHLTQLLWRSTQRVGCGVAECSQGQTRTSYWVCNYDPPGNYVGELPY